MRCIRSNTNTYYDNLIRSHVSLSDTSNTAEELDNKELTETTTTLHTHRHRQTHILTA